MSSDAPHKHKASLVEVLLATPLYVVGTVLAVVAAVLFVWGMQGGTDLTDTRPMGRVADGAAFALMSVALVWCGYFAVQRPPVRSSLVITLCFAAAAAVFLAVASSRTDAWGLLLGLALAFFYPAVIVIVRLVWLRRHPPEHS